MKFLGDAALIARRAWSMRFLYLSVVSGALDVALPLFAPTMDSRAFAWLSLIAAIAASISRVVAQPKIHDNH